MENLNACHGTVTNILCECLEHKNKAVGLLAAWFKFLLKNKEQTEALLTRSKVCVYLSLCVTCLCLCKGMCALNESAYECMSAHVCACM